MARVPISFYLSILAGIIVLFGHFAAYETGDTALNKITGATDRFYAVFRETALTMQHGCILRLEMALCGPAVERVFPHDAVAYLRVRYCRPPVQDSERVVGTSRDPLHGSPGYGGGDAVFAYYQLPVSPLALRTSARGSILFGRNGSNQRRLVQAAWNRTSGAMETIGTFLVRTCAVWWWFRTPLNMASFLIATYTTLSALGYLFSACAVTRWVSQVYVLVVADFLQCIEWEARRLALDVGVIMTERVCDFLAHVC